MSLGALAIGAFPVGGSISGFVPVPPPLPLFPATPDGNWALIAPPGQLNIMTGWRRPAFVPTVADLGEIGFTIFFATYAYVPDPIELVLKKPSGETIVLPPELVYRAGPGFFQIENIAGGTVLVYVTRDGDLSEVGTYHLYIEDVAGAGVLHVEG